MVDWFRHTYESRAVVMEARSKGNMLKDEIWKCQVHLPWTAGYAGLDLPEPEFKLQRVKLFEPDWRFTLSSLLFVLVLIKIYKNTPCPRALSWSHNVCNSKAYWFHLARFTSLRHIQGEKHSECKSEKSVIQFSMRSIAIKCITLHLYCDLLLSKSTNAATAAQG